jgi:hypothetical protein
MPVHDLVTNEFIANETYCDGRFRGKLHDREKAGLVSLHQLWKPGPVLPGHGVFLPTGAVEDLYDQLEEFPDMDDVDAETEYASEIQDFDEGAWPGSV